MENKFLKVENREEWTKLLDRVLFRTFFHLLDWEDFLEKEFKWLKFERYIWSASGGQALISLARIKVGKKEKLVSHPFCEYGGPLPLVAQIDGRQFSQDILEYFKNTSLKISFHPKLLDYFHDLPATETERETYFFENLDTLSASAIWDKLDRNRRRSINAAKEQGFEVVKCKNSSELKELYDLYVQNLKRHKALPYPFSFFNLFFLHPRAEIMIVKSRDSIVGGNIFLFYDKMAHSFLCGFRETDKKQGAHSLALWEEIQKAKDVGFSILDLGGTRKGTGIGDFKSRWGAKAHHIYELKNYSSASRLKKSFIRDLWSFMPISLIKILSPHLLKYKL